MRAGLQVAENPAEKDSLLSLESWANYNTQNKKQIYCGIAFLAAFVVVVICIAVAVTLAIVLSDGNSNDRITYGSAEEHAIAIQGMVPLFDGHNDLPWRIRSVWKGNMSAFDLNDFQKSTETDIPRLRMGRVGAQFWSVYVPCEDGAPPVQKTMDQIDLVYQMAERYPDAFQIATTAHAVTMIFREGKVASLMGMEGGHSINNSLSTLRMFHQMGARYMTLTHTCSTPWADSAHGPFLSNGLSAFGLEVVREMNRLGMVVDISHVSVAAMKAALRHSLAPVMFSHSGVYSICPSIRNVPDDVLDMLKENNGIIMIPFYPVFLTCSDNATMTDILNHIDYVVKRIGADHVGFGSDFDGISVLVTDVQDVSKYVSVTTQLLLKGYSEDDVKKIIGGNMLRVLGIVEQVAKHLQKTTLPSQAVCC